MTSDKFFQEIIKQLLIVSNNGDTENDMGTKLIGHNPSIAPRAFIHVVFQPLNESDLEDFITNLGRKVPEQLKSLLSFANGMMIFSGTIRVFGFLPNQKKGEVTVHNYPSDIMIPNVSARVNGLGSDDVVIAWYKEDGSYVVSQKSGIVTRFDVLGNGEEMQSWSDINTWLISEIIRLNKNQYPE